LTRDQAMATPATFPIANPVAVLREEFDDWAVLLNPATAACLRCFLADAGA
jgi:hypothetical protein